MATKPKTDWERIERDYRANVLSIREIAKRHGVSDTAIRKHAKEHGWERDLGERIAAAVRATLVRSETPEEKEQRTEAEIVAEAAATQVDVIRAHRKTISRAWAIYTHLEASLFDVAAQPGQLRQVAQELIDREVIPETAVRRLEMALNLRENSATFRELTAAAKLVIGLERQAFGIKDDDEGDAETYEQRLDRLASGAEPAPTEAA